MRFFVTFDLSNSEGVMVFSAENERAAYGFALDLITVHGHTRVSPPQRRSGNIDELYKIVKYPWLKPRGTSLLSRVVDHDNAC